MRQISSAVVLLIVCLLAGMSAARAQSNCSNVSMATLTSGTSITVTPAYAPFSGSSVTSPFAVTVRNGSGGNCSIAPIFVRSSAPIAMSNGSFSLTYDINYNGTSVAIINGQPLSGFYVTLGGNSSFTFNTFNVAIPASQTSAAAGTYTDTAMAIHLYAYRFGWQLVRTYPLTITATINKTCTMSAASPASLNFTSAISNGIPNPAVVLTSTLSSINCTAPSKITLSGSAMQHVPAIGAAAGFDNFINYQATGTLGGATATLTTSSGSTVTSSGYNVPTGTTVGASLPVNVNLLTGQRLQSGTYSTTLSVTIDPTL
ncbi:MAG: hypothetical protein SFW09_18970 [Hyphomicrobiaceae bacterium]|nr:hypothetical protein [Hyphomicrobiaceae bacterium]